VSVLFFIDSVYIVRLRGAAKMTQHHIVITRLHLKIV